MFEMKTAFLYQCILDYLLLNMVVWWGCISRRGRGRGGKGGTGEQPLFDEPPLI